MKDGAVLMDTATGDCFELNGAGRDIWHKISAGADVDDVVDDLLRAYEVDRATLAADVRKLVEELARRGILVPGPR